MTRFTKELRQKIVKEFAIRHNGNFNPALFLAEVKEQGKNHPAFAWFEWDTKKAAQAYLLEQARSFASDLRVIFKVEEVIGPSSVRIKEMAMPMVLSPLQTRHKGGGYRLVDPDDQDHIEEHCRQAAKALAQWLERYQAALAHIHVKAATVHAIVGKLEYASEKRSAA